MANAKYELEPRSHGMWAVVRVGPKGGKRVVAVYKDQGNAMRVQSVLVQAARFEA